MSTISDTSSILSSHISAVALCSDKSYPKFRPKTAKIKQSGQGWFKTDPLDWAKMKVNWRRFDFIQTGSLSFTLTQTVWKTACIYDRRSTTYLRGYCCWCEKCERAQSYPCIADCWRTRSNGATAGSGFVGWGSCQLTMSSAFFYGGTPCSSWWARCRGMDWCNCCCRSDRWSDS